MAHHRLERVGDELRRLGHERQRMVEKIVRHAEAGSQAGGPSPSALPRCSGWFFDVVGLANVEWPQRPRLVCSTFGPLSAV